MHIRSSRLLSIFVISVLLNGCGAFKTSHNKNQAYIDKNKTKEKEQTIKNPVCVYETDRGIAVLTTVIKEEIIFRFFPGDEQFVYSKDKLNLNEYTVGTEVKALRQQTSDDGCEPVEYHIPKL